MSEDAELTIGVRPEHVRLDGADGPGTLSCRIELCEPTGMGAIIHLRLGDLSLKAYHLGRADWRGGAPTAVSLPAEHLHLFDGASGLRVA